MWLLAASAADAALPPGTPANLTGTADDAAVYVSWFAPPDNGAPIDSYKVTANGVTTTTMAGILAPSGAAPSVIAPCGQCTTVYFSGLTNGSSYSFTVAAHNSAGWSAVPAVSAAVTPQFTPEQQTDPPANVTASASGQSVTVTWTDPASTNGLIIDRYMVEADDMTLTKQADSTKQIGAPAAVYHAGWKYACATCHSVTFDGLTGGHSYKFGVYAHANGNPPTYSRSTWVTDVGVTAPSCPAAQVCLSVNGTTNNGPMQWRASGFVGGPYFPPATQQGPNAVYTYGGPATDLVQALKPQAFRTGGCVAPLTAFPQCQWDAANTSASITDVLSDEYGAKTGTSSAGGPRPPWECWSCYTSDLQSILTSPGATNIAPPYDKPLPNTSVYWDIQNEPGWQLGPNQRGTTSLYLQQLLKAYQAVQAVNPNIQVVLPSLGAFVDTSLGRTVGNTSNLSDPHELGFDSVIPFTVQNNINVGAFSWHGNSGMLDDNPAVVPYEVDNLRYLMSEYRVPGTPKIFINEYDPAFANLLPGWSAGWIAALEQAKVDQANRACWVENAGVLEIGTTYDQCMAGTMDGLFTSIYDTPSATNGVTDQPLQPAANYWVYRFYANMSGAVLPTSTSDNSMTALATKNDATSTMDILVGRHQSCTSQVNTDCNANNAPEVAYLPTPLATPATITVSYPYPATSVTASITNIPNMRGPVAQPPAQTQMLPVTNGTVTITLPAVSDGDAYTVELTKAA